MAAGLSYSCHVPRPLLPLEQRLEGTGGDGKRGEAHMPPGDKGSVHTSFQTWVFGYQVHAADLPKRWAIQSLTH